MVTIKLDTGEYIKETLVSPYVLQEVSDKGRSEAYLAKSAEDTRGFYRSCEGDEGTTGVYHDLMSAARAEGKTVVIKAVFRD